MFKNVEETLADAPPSLIASRSQRNRLWVWQVYGSGWGSYPVAGFSMIIAELSGSIAR